MKTDVFRDGKVHVQKRMCDTCIFRPGNLMHLNEERVEEMVAKAHKIEGVIPCHKKLREGGGEAVCRGFFDKHPTSLLQVAARMGYVKEVVL